MKPYFLLFLLLVSCTVSKNPHVVISIKEQKAKIIAGARTIKAFPVSTGRGGIGNKPGSAQTPTGEFEIVKKIGDGMPPTIGIKGASITKNVKGNDPIIGRSLWLSGLEPQNKNTLNRLIRIHGTPYIDKIGQAVSLGCVRFKPEDIISFCNYVSVGSKLQIQ